MIDELKRLERELPVARATYEHLRRIGAVQRPIAMIVFDMALRPGKSYRDALADWAAYENDPAWSAHRWHTEICYWLLTDKQDVPDGVAAWFGAQAKEVRRIADGISA